MPAKIEVVAVIEEKNKVFWDRCACLAELDPPRMKLSIAVLRKICRAGIALGVANLILLRR